MLFGACPVVRSKNLIILALAIDFNPSPPDLSPVSPPTLSKCNCQLIVCLAVSGIQPTAVCVTHVYMLLVESPPWHVTAVTGAKCGATYLITRGGNKDTTFDFFLASILVCICQLIFLYLFALLELSAVPVIHI